MDPLFSFKIREMLLQDLEVRESHDEVVRNFQSVSDASNFFSNVRKIAPAFEYSHDLLFKTVEAYTPSAPKILDLGAGIGRLSKMALERFPECHVTLLDVSEPLLEEASRQLSVYHGRFETISGDLFSPDLVLPADAFDSVISSFAVCHGRSASDYRNLYAKIQDCLKPPGCFLCLDLVCGAEVDLTIIGFQDWGKLLESHFSETDIQKIIQNVIVEDYPLSIPQHLALLSEVGFKSPDVLWKENVFALYGGFE